jgi:hypothetical protein
VDGVYEANDWEILSIAFRCEIESFYAILIQLGVEFASIDDVVNAEHIKDNSYISDDDSDVEDTEVVMDSLAISTRIVTLNAFAEPHDSLYDDNKRDSNQILQHAKEISILPATPSHNSLLPSEIKRSKPSIFSILRTAGVQDRTESIESATDNSQSVKTGRHCLPSISTPHNHYTWRPILARISETSECSIQRSLRTQFQKNEAHRQIIRQTYHTGPVPFHLRSSSRTFDHNLHDQTTRSDNLQTVSYQDTHIGHSRNPSYFNDDDVYSSGSGCDVADSEHSGDAYDEESENESETDDDTSDESYASNDDDGSVGSDSADGSDLN